MCDVGLLVHLVYYMVLIDLALAVCLWTCTFYEPLWDNVFLDRVVVITCIC